MHGTAAFACLLGLHLAGCWGPESTKHVEPADASDAADALTRALRFDDGERQTGALPTNIDGSVALFAPSAQLRFAPGDEDVLALELSDPNGELPQSFLIHFEGASEHLRVPVTDQATLGVQHITGAFALDDEVCAKLCDQLYAFDMAMMVSFGPDRMGPATIRPAALDCRGEGDPAYCGDDVTPAQFGMSGIGGAGGFGGVGGVP